MKLVPYIRFGLALTIVYNLTVQALFEIFIDEQSGRYAFYLLGPVAILFALYLVLTGVRELKKIDPIGTRYFKVFGLTLEVASCFGLFYTIFIFIQINAPLWAIAFVALLLTSLLSLIVVDWRRMSAP